MVAFQSACSVLSTINLEDEVNILEDKKKILRDLCSSESKKSEPNTTMFGNCDRFRDRSRGGHRSRSNNRRPNENRGKPEYYKRHSRERSYQRRPHENRRKSQETPRRTYEVEVVCDGDDNSFNKDDNVSFVFSCRELKMDKNKSIFENEVEDRALVDSGCPALCVEFLGYKHSRTQMV